MELQTKRNLNGLPSNLALSYIGTGSHSGNGKMGEWLIHFAKLNNLKEIEIDVLKKTIIPSEIQSKDILFPLEKLNEMISSNLKKNSLDISFLSKAILRFEIPIIKDNFDGTIYCFPFLEDVAGNIYKGKKKVIVKTDLLFNPKKSNNINFK